MEDKALVENAYVITVHFNIVHLTQYKPGCNLLKYKYQ